LLSKVGPLITKMETNLRKPIPPDTRLPMTIRYLASGDGLHSISLNYRIGRSTATLIIRETCEAIWDCLSPEILFTPSENGWRKIALEFEKRWNFPNCIGAIDGKHVAIICPKKAGSTYYNYKQFHSIVILALVSATYKFLIVDIGAQGRHSDGGIFKNSAMGQRFYNNDMYLPAPSAISARHQVPYVIVADKALQLNSFTMRPYPSKNLTFSQRIFNYRLSSVRHNLLMNTSYYCGDNYDDKVSANGQIMEGEWRSTYRNTDNYSNISHCSNNYSKHAGEIRNTFMDYFMNEGKVPWQEQSIQRNLL
ncbi:Putative nuclease HARBI1, partial [Cyphomyrmex costatus]